MIDELFYARAAASEREREVTQLVRTSQLLREAKGATQRKARARWGAKMLQPILSLMGRIS